MYSHSTRTASILAHSAARQHDAALCPTAQHRVVRSLQRLVPYHANASPILQIRAKYNSVLVDLFRETFCWLPLAHLLSDKVCLGDCTCRLH